MSSAQTSDTEPFIVCRSLMKVYRIGEGDVLALQGLDLDVHAGEMLGIVGASGSGKSTLLSVLGGLTTPTAGSVSVGGLDVVNCRARRRDRYRREQVGFVWQHSHQNLLPDLDATENVMRPMVAAGLRNARSSARDLLGRVGLTHRDGHRPARLSGGEQARVSLAVALALDPQLILADEPTGELDSTTTDELFALMRDLSDERGVAQVIVSHDPDLVGHVDRVIGIRDGRTSTESRRIDGGFADGDDIVADTSSDVSHTLVVDDVGRVQLPADIIESLGIGGRVSADVVDDHARLRPIDPATGLPRGRSDTDRSVEDER